MTNAEYHAHPAISKSALFKIADSPQKFRYYMDHPAPQTPSLAFGSAFHKLVLEPDDFESEFVVMPDIDRRTKAGREQYAEFRAAFADHTIISQEDMETIRGMADAVLANKYAAALIKQSRHEQSFFWTDDMTGEECKCRPDILLDNGPIHIIADLKSCESAQPENFRRDSIKYGYHLQSYMYTTGVGLNTGHEYQFVFIAVEKKPPYAVNVMAADELYLRYGEDTFRELIGIYHECKESGDWWGYNGFAGTINNLSLPDWLAKEYQ